MRTITTYLIEIVALMIGLLNGAGAFDQLVEKEVFEMPSYTTVGGETIKGVRIGWEAYGTANEKKDNVILITHFFSGDSHAAGKYSDLDQAPGYWDSIIGAGKPIDTDKFYVISSDTLVNLNTKLPTVTTTGPATINPDTGKPYGLSFPTITIRDFVNVQKALLEHLGITKIHAVMGASMGAFQAIEWASAYPNMVERVIPVIGSGEADAYLIGWLNVTASPIKLDPNWNNGDYYGKVPPARGLAEAFKILTLLANHWEWAVESFGRDWAEVNKDPVKAMSHQYKVEAVLDQVAAQRAQISDANHFLYLVKANQTFLAGHNSSLAQGLARIEAPVLLIYTDEDQIFVPEHVRRTAVLIEADGTPVRIVELQGVRGHLDGVLSIGQAGPHIKDFLSQ